MASHGVHANSKGLIFDIGSLDLDIPGYKKRLLQEQVMRDLLTQGNWH
jgi:hypothetical protein